MRSTGTPRNLPYLKEQPDILKEKTSLDHGVLFFLYILLYILLRIFYIYVHERYWSIVGFFVLVLFFLPMSLPDFVIRVMLAS